MSRTVFPFVAPDVSAFARSLSRELEGCEHNPGHVQLLNMLTRSAGYQNFQHFRAQFAAQDRLEQPPPAPQPVDYVLVGRVARHFDEAGRLVRWPSKGGHWRLCLWAMWSHIPARSILSEKQINAVLCEQHTFGDPALLRREMFNTKMVTRTRDCREYQRLEQTPPPEAVALIRHLSGRKQVTSAH